jgi:hypothetical protein
MANIESVLHNHCNVHCTLEQTSPQRFDALSDLRVENYTADCSGTWSWRIGGRAVPERALALSRRCSGGVGGGDVVCWAESGSKPNGLCRFGVKNARGVSFSCEKRGGCGETRGGCGEKVGNSGEKFEFAGKKKMYHPRQGHRPRGPRLRHRRRTVARARSLQGLAEGGTATLDYYFAYRLALLGEHVPLANPRFFKLAFSSLALFPLLSEAWDCLSA